MTSEAQRSSLLDHGEAAMLEEPPPGAACMEMAWACSQVGFLMPLIERILSPTCKPKGLFACETGRAATTMGLERSLSLGNPTMA